MGQLHYKEVLLQGAPHVLVTATLVYTSTPQPEASAKLVISHPGEDQSVAALCAALVSQAKAKEGSE